MLIAIILWSLAAILGGSDWRVAPGFVVREYADNRLAPDITCLTVDPHGRVVVAGPGYIRLLSDEKDGRATRGIDLVSAREAAMGLFREQRSLYAVVDGGLWRWPLDDHGTSVNGPGQKLLPLRTGGEHHAHAVRRGPDGWLYLMVGDGTGITADFVTSASSPIREPVGGCLLRVSPDGQLREIVADGFRNAYDFAFDPHGFAWTFDSDNERCVGLPWYEPTRIYRIIPGAHHGWRAPQHSDTWRFPPYFLDVAAPEATCGRGSPTGVVWQTHPGWPAEFHGLYLADWTFGTIWLYRPGSAPQRFLEPRGETGFAPTALAVHPTTGDLFVSTGGRGTRGAVFRIHPIVSTSNRVSTWSPPDWAEQARQLVERRARHGQPRAEDARFAWEQASQADHRVVLSAAADLLARLPASSLHALQAEARNPGQLVALGYALATKDAPAAVALASRAFRHPDASVARRIDALRVMQRALGDITSPQHRGSILAGYTWRGELPTDRHAELRRMLRDRFPTGDTDLDREISRMLAMLMDDDVGFARKVGDRLSSMSDPIDEVHYLIVLSRLHVSWDDPLRNTVTSCMLGFDRKYAERGYRRDRNWSLRMLELHRELAERDPKLNAAILRHPDFGRPEHVLWTRCPKFDRAAAARKFLDLSAGDPNWNWTPELVALLAELPPETTEPLLRRLGRVAALRDSVIPLLARRPRREDLELYIQGLGSQSLNVIRTSLAACRKLCPPSDAKTLAAMIRCGQQLPAGREANEIRRLLAETLDTLTGQRHGTDFSQWAKWLKTQHPEAASSWAGIDGVDEEGWRRRLSRIDWSRGDPERGRTVFEKAQCASCHGRSQALGPDLAGLGQRFSREDRFTAILQPNRDVPVRYRLTQIETTDGRTYQGMIVYEATDGVILQVGAAETIRIPESRIESRRPTDRSMMPAGLLDGLTDDEIADLDAYLRSLR
ncbi:MAG: c-type cytochrome [Gemmataceae bacterium]|nr:c-type cytochrome [Gemmataceae bacterium]